MNRLKFGKLSDLPENGVLEKRILARRVLVVRHNGELYGIEGDCKHMKATLASGKIRDGVITCRWHGWEYELVSGRCLTVDKMNLKTYPVEIDGDDIYVII